MIANLDARRAAERERFVDVRREEELRGADLHEEVTGDQTAGVVAGIAAKAVAAHVVVAPKLDLTPS